MTASRMAGAICARTMLLGIIGIGAVAALWAGTLPGADAGTKGPVKDTLCADTVEQRFSLSQGSLVELQGMCGTIVITAWDEPEVCVRLDKKLETLKPGRTWPWQGGNPPFATQGEAEAYFNALGFTADQNADGLSLVGAQPDRRRGVVLTATYDIRVPHHAAVSVRGAEGAIVCDGLYGPIDALTAHGDIRLDGVAGPVRAETSAGDIRVAFARGTAPADEVVCRTLDGAIHVALPAESEFDLVVDALSGRFTSDFPVTMAPPLGGSRIQAQVGAGGPLVSFNTLDGDIKLTAL